MKKILVLFIMSGCMLSCTKDISSLNIDAKRATVVPSYTLFSNAERNLSDFLASSSVNLNIFRLITQQWTETTYTDESNFDLSTRNIPQSMWGTLYSGSGEILNYGGVLKNLDQAKKLIPSDVKDAGVQKNQLAITDILEVYSYNILVSTFGNVPYSQALDANNFFPKYDDAKTIYVDLLKRLDADISAMNAASASFGDADLLYGGDVSAWKGFAYSLKFKMGMLIADSDPTLAKTTVESANAGAFSSNANNAIFKYYPVTPNTNPVWVDLVQSGRGDFVATNTIINSMTSLNDPRTQYFFTKDVNGGYSGGVAGKGNSYPTFSHAGDLIVAPDYPNDLLDYSEVEFLRAEAIERGMNIPGTADAHYNNAVTSSILFWGGNQSDAAAYLAQPSVNYTTATGTYKQKIGIQKWIALYNRGFDAWTEIRRLDYPVLPAPAIAISNFPVRFTYPANEQNLNPRNYKEASAAVGGDKVDTKLFWDKF